MKQFIIQGDYPRQFGVLVITPFGKGSLKYFLADNYEPLYTEVEEFEEWMRDVSEEARRICEENNALLYIY